MRFKLMLILAAAILAATIPLFFLIIQQQEKEKFSMLVLNGQAYSKMLARSMKTIIYINGGDIEGSKVDARDMMTILSPLKGMGLLYADTFLRSPSPDKDGVIIAYYPRAQGASTFEPDHERLDAARIKELSAIDIYREIEVPGHGLCYEFVTPGIRTVTDVECVGRLIFSRSILLAPIMRLRYTAALVLVLVLAVVGALGAVLSRAVTVPLRRLTVAARGIRDGDYAGMPEIRSRDEIGELAGALSHMAGVINMKIVELTAVNRRLERLDRLKDDFLSGVTRELRTPLFGILGIAESMARGAAGPLNQEAAHDLEIIQSEGKRLVRLVNDIHDFTRLRNSDVFLRLSPVYLHSHAAVCLSMVAAAAAGKGLSLTNTVPVDLPPVRGDGERIRQVLLSLLDNAVKFTAEGSVEIGAAAEGDDRIILWVSDTGPGVPGDRLAELNHTAGDAESTAGDTGGRGLGLTIVKNLVQLHGGELMIQSSPQGGTIARIDLPRWTGTGQETLRLPEIPEPGTGPRPLKAMSREAENGETPSPRQVLSVSDDAVLQQTIINRFSVEGLQVSCAGDAESAIEITARGPLPDLVLIDGMLKRVSGYDLCRLLRERYAHHELPVLMLIYQDGAEEITLAGSSGATDYVAKPVNGDVLLARARNCIALKDSVALQWRYSKIKMELEIANEVQKALMPQSLPQLRGASIYVRYNPAMEIGGDFYFFHSPDERRLAIFLADVSGHGIPAAIFGAKLDTLFSLNSQWADEPSALLDNINGMISGYTHGQYVTALCLYLDLDRQTLVYSNAGHTPLLLQRAPEGALEERHIFGRPLGLFPDSKYGSLRMELQGGERIIIHTDGISEARNGENEVFEKELHVFAVKNRWLSATGFSDGLFDALYRWTGAPREEGLEDDATLILIDIGDDLRD